MIISLLAGLLNILHNPRQISPVKPSTISSLNRHEQNSCSQEELTKYKMWAFRGDQGQKFTCPPESEVDGCGCMMFFNNGSKAVFTGQDHLNPRVCSCRALTCGPDCFKIVTKVYCCGPHRRCPMNDLNRPRYRTDWTCVLDVERSYGKNDLGLKQAIRAGADYIKRYPSESVNIMIRRGTYVIDTSTGPGILLKNINPVDGARFIISGEGKNMTTLKFSDWTQDMIYIQNSSRISLQGLHLTRRTPGATQGFVRSVDNTQVTLEIPAGFPEPPQLYNGDHEAKTRTYLRKYTDTRDPRIVTENNFQIPWDSASRVGRIGGRLWSFKLRSFTSVPNYEVGDLIGVKAKCCGLPTSCSYFVRESKDIVFRGIRWTRQSRGVFRYNTQRIAILNSEILRDAPINGLGWCLSSSGGGPQIGQPNDPNVHNIRIENFYAENTGDDAIGFFNVKENVLLRNIWVKDSFARSILLYKSNQLEAEDIHTTRSPVCFNDNEQQIRKIVDFDDNDRFYRTLRYFNTARYITTRDPQGLISSNCTMNMEAYLADLNRPNHNP